jgi:hypothetical protein
VEDLASFLEFLNEGGEILKRGNQTYRVLAATRHLQQRGGGTQGGPGGTQRGYRA